MTTVLATMCCYNAIIQHVVMLFLLVLLLCYDAASCCRLGDFIVAVVLTDRGCVHCCHVHHDCDITIVMNNVIRENMVAQTQYLDEYLGTISIILLDRKAIDSV
jgi:hypothetical protein